MAELTQPALDLAAPLTNPLLALLVTLLLSSALRRGWRWPKAAAAVGALVLALSGAYHWAWGHAAAARWLAALNSPLFAVYLLIVLPAMVLPRNRWYRLFLVLPALALAWTAILAVDSVRNAPADVSWVQVRPAWLMAGVASLLVLVQPLLNLRHFRFAVRLAFFLVLVYGGFALRQDYADYRAMLGRRQTARPGIMNLSETSPVLQNERRMTYLPSAPCRFTADGGYVQGCNMELAQRLLQLDEGKLAARDPGAINAMGVILGALTMFAALSFLVGRAGCGWLCPLSALGAVLDRARAWLRLPYWRPARPVKLAYLFSGMGFASLGAAMAKAYPHLDADGRFLGCKIPLYPFCKICPSQQLCPVAAGGPDAYSGMPTMEWGWGFFKAACIALLALFGLSFLLGRRLWCRFCPMGMISGVFNRGGLVALRKDALKCNRCGVCAEVCPMDIARVRDEMRDPDVSSYHCVLCLKCVEKCPRDGCLALQHAGASVTESRFVLAQRRGRGGAQRSQSGFSGGDNGA